ncbi:Virilizer, N-terminal, partial [Dillenia turbinata]
QLMGRPEPCVLFAQTFVHPQLDEYVDEVIFAEPIVITACEFIEQNSSSTSPSVTLLGATSPPSFALEIFVQCEGETRFRRLCQPFLYSHSSSNVLEVEAVVTNHLVVRGSYRSLSLVIYGNMAEDLGQFNIEVDIDSSLTNIVCSTAGKLEDLPPALYASNRTFDEIISSLKTLSFGFVPSDISAETRQLLQLIFKILELSSLNDMPHKVVSIVVEAASSYAKSLSVKAIHHKRVGKSDSKLFEVEPGHVLVEAKKQLLDLYENLQHLPGDQLVESLRDHYFLESEADLATSKQLVDMFGQLFQFDMNSSSLGCLQLFQRKKLLLGLSLALFLCSGKASCFYFVNCGGMKWLARLFNENVLNSSATTLMLLGVVEQATRNSIGCEGFLGWWPREEENIPLGVSEGYSELLKLLLQRQRHDVASLSTYVLHRLRVYEVASRYELAVLSVLQSLSAEDKITSDTLKLLECARSQVKKLLKLINSCGPIEDPSPVGCASRSLILGLAEGSLSFQMTRGLISQSTCCFADWDIDSTLLLLLKERGFLPLSAALLSSSVLRSGLGVAMDTFVDIASSIETILLSFLFSHSGLTFLLLNPEVTSTIILSLGAGNDVTKEECIPSRYATTLLTKGFFCRPGEVGTIIELHLRVVSAVDCLLTLNPQSEEFLWVLWELCGLSRSDCGRQALLSLVNFPEAISILIEALHSAKDLEPDCVLTGASPINIAIFHSAAEIFEVIVADFTACSLDSWIEHAMDLHKALYSSSPGSNRKDAPTRLLEWVDAGVVYHKNGAIGLLRYAAVLASGGDAHFTSTSTLVSDSMDVENVIGDPSGGSDTHIIENLLNKLITDKSFEGIILRESSVAQLTTAFRILAFISDNSAVATALYDEGAIMVIYIALVNCRFMMERFSNNYDYLVDDGTECNSTSDLLLERTREHSLVDLLIPSLVLLINLLQKLQEASEQHRNTKLMMALLRVHREISPKLAACATNLSSPYPGSALGLGAVCHLLVSALAFWPAYGWHPSLFSSLLQSVQTTSLLALGPKETCSLLCLLSDLLPVEGVWLWKNGMPLLSALRTLSVGTLLGHQKERQADWYLKSRHLDMLLGQLAPHVDKIAQIILHYAISTLVVIQDMLRVFIVRVAFQKVEIASSLLRPIISWISDHLSESCSPSETVAFKIYRLLDFLASLLEHPHGKLLLYKEGAVQMLVTVLDRCISSINYEGKQILGSKSSAKSGLGTSNWCFPALKSFSLLCDSQTPMQFYGKTDRQYYQNLGCEDCSSILPRLLKLCQDLPVGRELLACLTAFKELGSCSEGQQALISCFLRINQAGLNKIDFERKNGREEHHNCYEYEWKEHPPLLYCLKNLLGAIDCEAGMSLDAIEAVAALCLGALRLCMAGKSLNMDSVGALKFLFGLPFDESTVDGSPVENIKYLQDLASLLSSKVSSDDDNLSSFALSNSLYQVSEYANSLLLLLQKPTGSVQPDEIISTEDVSTSSKMRHLPDRIIEIAEDYSFLGGLGDKFQWECPETLPDRMSQTALSLKRKMSSMEGPNRRARGDTAPGEVMTQNTFSRGTGAAASSTGPTRRDTFRQRKPNTSRPPSMHVDDYVARERNVEGNTNSNVISIQRIVSSGGRPPSIHVDEFMARQRERQNPTALAAGETASQIKTAASENGRDSEKPKPLKMEIDDDLQGIDIVFDAEESMADDKLPFPQPDDGLQQPAPVVVKQSSPHSIVEETESDMNDTSQFSRLGTPLASNVDENSQSEFSSRMSVSRTEIPLTREPSVSSDKKYMEQSDETKNVPAVKTSAGFDLTTSASSSGFPASVFNKTSAASLQLPADSRILTPSFLNQQQAGNAPIASGSQGLYEQKYALSQPPLPPMPPPATISPVLSQAPDPVSGQSSPFVNPVTDAQLPQCTAFQVQTEYLSPFNSSSASVLASYPMQDMNYSRPSQPSPGGSARPLPPLPPTPPPFLSVPFSSQSLKTSGSHTLAFSPSAVGTSELSQTSMSPINDTWAGNLSASGAGLTSYPPPQLMPPLLFGRPAFQEGENLASISQNLPIPLQSIQSLQSLGQLQPLQPPQLPRPPQPPQHPRPTMQASQQAEQGVSVVQNSVQMHVQQVQMMQQSQASPVHVYYQSQQQKNLSQPHQQQHALSQLHKHGDGVSQQQEDSGMSLQDYFSSPEAIQSLLSDRDKLCQLLEQHPKLMQMLQVWE